ncbi:MAG: hypothetical protein CL917_19200 [Deltaproteobacteria bacterium]|nr:hypothetical protein [Deltaproteobacteria bacterium]
MRENGTCARNDDILLKDEIALRLISTLVAVFGIAGLGMMLRLSMSGQKESQSRMGVRFGIEASMLAAIWIPAYLGGAWLLAVAIVLGCICASELYGTFEFGEQRPWKISGILIGIVFLLLTSIEPSLLSPLLISTLICYWILRTLSHQREDFSKVTARAKSTCFGVLYPFLCLAFLVEMGAQVGGFGFIVFYMGLTAVNDSAAYLIGSSIGRHKIFPTLSPNKTVEGVVGGIVGTVAVSFALAFAVPELSLLERVGGAVLIAIAGLCGDLFASRLKRRVGVKDYGDAIPTQGGVLDVYDAFIFVTPVFYYYWLWIVG